MSTETEWTHRSIEMLLALSSSEDFEEVGNDGDVVTLHRSRPSHGLWTYERGWEVEKTSPAGVLTGYREVGTLPEATYVAARWLNKGAGSKLISDCARPVTD